MNINKEQRSTKKKKKKRQSETIINLIEGVDKKKKRTKKFPKVESFQKGREK